MFRLFGTQEYRLARFFLCVSLFFLISSFVIFIPLGTEGKVVDANMFDLLAIASFCFGIVFILLAVCFDAFAQTKRLKKLEELL
tara:strand:- start:6795 stop:7046 length:252 start_codon:yes stop_codon:yes gene_type:complete